MEPSVVDLIGRKRDGGRLDAAEIKWLIDAFTDGTVADYQMAAMAMAVYYEGLDTEELAAWTSAMLASGDVLDLSGISGPKVDKHSTGGVGDKVSIPLGPIVAACGVFVPMMSGRGLGHTGGTLDKLESIPGFTVQFTAEEFEQLVGAHGLILAGQSERLVPADRALYALRDATATVASIPLISSSIMSKKLAEDLDGLVLDVKVGAGAFMEEIESARQLARTMVGIGESSGVDVTALLTDMNQPLGTMVGNSNEIIESIQVLRGTGDERLTGVTMALAEEMLRLAGIQNPAEAAADAVRSGAALEKFGEVIESQGGNAAVIEDITLLPMADTVVEVPARGDGFVIGCNARTVGVEAMRLGAGRARKEDDIDHGVGIEILAPVGAVVTDGAPLALVTTRDADQVDIERIRGAWTLGPESPPPTPLVIDRVATSD